MDGSMKRVSFLGLLTVFGLLGLPVGVSAATATTVGDYDFVNGNAVSADAVPAMAATMSGGLAPLDAGAISFRFYTWGEAEVAVDQSGSPLIVGAEAITLPEQPAVTTSAVGGVCALLACGVRLLTHRRERALSGVNPTKADKSGRSGRGGSGRWRSPLRFEPAR